MKGELGEIQKMKENESLSDLTCITISHGNDSALRVSPREITSRQICSTCSTNPIKSLLIWRDDSSDRDVFRTKRSACTNPPRDCAVVMATGFISEACRSNAQFNKCWPVWWDIKRNRRSCEDGVELSGNNTAIWMFNSDATQLNPSIKERISSWKISINICAFGAFRQSQINRTGNILS